MELNKALDIIKNADLSAETKVNKIANNLRDIISRKTDNFTNPDAISTEGVDISAIIVKKGYDIQDYKSHIGDPTNVSEKDVVIRLAERLSGKKSEPSGKSKSLALKEKEAQAEMEIMAMEFEFLNL